MGIRSRLRYRKSILLPHFSAKTSTNDQTAVGTILGELANYL
jgi:hypothetical protein